MEQIRRIVEVLWELFFALVDLFEPLFRAIFERLLGTEIPEGGARPLTTVLFLLLVVWGVNKAFFSVTKSTASQPMKITLSTDKTPAQVVREDWEKRMKAVFLILVVVAIVYMLGRG
ncbi:MAG: hypothetical protein N2204_03210 [Anaerolineae bacterium]|nr:hypothetical protein [Anaerolineae bacterium]